LWIPQTAVKKRSCGTSQKRHKPPQRKLRTWPAVSGHLFTAGAVHVPSRIDGSLSFGQYMHSIRNLPAGAGSQLLSFSDPGLSFWTYIYVEPSGFAFRFCRGLIEYRLIGLATKKY
jgi:hypothetical protein